VAGKLVVVVSVLALSMGLASCTKIEEGPSPTPEGNLGTVSNPFTDAIPREYGRLVGVSSVGDEWNALWFEKEDKTIVVVGVNWIERKMLEKVAVISRK
jgi:hypothetical protein